MVLRRQSLPGPPRLLSQSKTYVNLQPYIDRKYSNSPLQLVLQEPIEHGSLVNCTSASPAGRALAKVVAVWARVLGQGKLRLEVLPVDEHSARHGDRYGTASQQLQQHTILYRGTDCLKLRALIRASIIIKGRLFRRWKICRLSRGRWINTRQFARGQTEKSWSGRNWLGWPYSR